MAKSTSKPAKLRAAKGLADPTHPGFLLDNSPLYLLARTYGRYTLAMERSLKAIGMDLPRWRVLMIVNENNPSSISEIADRAVMRLSTMTKVARRLEREGLVRLGQRVTDGRITDVFITGAGVEAVEQIRRVASRVFNQAFEGFSDAEVATLIDMERRLLSNLSLLP